MFENLRNKFSLEAHQWKRFESFFERCEVAAKTVLLEEGEISKQAFVIEKGCVRAWFNNNGKDVTFQFFFENNSVASIESFRKNIPSPVTIETIEPSALWYISKQNLNTIIEEIKKIPTLRDVFINAVFERTYNYMAHFLSSIKDTPQQRYLNLIKESPEIIRRVPQHYIASYLGVTTVHLSRIKSKILKGDH